MTELRDKLLENFQDLKEASQTSEYLKGYRDALKNIANDIDAQMLEKERKQLYDTGKPPLGLIPKQLHEERVKAERFDEVRSAITRRCDAGLKIDKEWIDEYNELAELVNEREKVHVANHSRASFYKQF